MARQLKVRSNKFRFSGGGKTPPGAQGVKGLDTAV